jgi:hypothetical protein
MNFNGNGKGKGEGKVIPVLMGSGGIAPDILNLGITWRWVFSFTSWQLPLTDMAYVSY